VTTTEDVFAEFVRARWEDLEPAARVVVLDADVAREVTAEALARLRTRWRTVEEEGRPADEARRLVLSAALARSTSAAPVADPAAAPDAGPSPRDDDVVPDPADGDDPVVAALVRHLRALEPLDRALVACREVWGAGPEDVARWLDRAAPALTHRADAVARGLEQAHATAREREGAGAAPWALERDLARAVDDLLGGLTDPPDPAVLVEARVRRVRRRSLVLGLAAAAAAVGGVAAAVTFRSTPTAPAAAALPGPTDPAWASTSRWPTRGPLAADPLLRAFPGQHAAWGDHVLWAGDLGSRRLVVLWSDEGPTSDDTGIRLFTGPRGADLVVLDEVDLIPMGMPATDCVAVVAADGPDATTADRSLLLVLGRPVVERASYSPVRRPTASGGLERSWTELVLDQGIGALVLPHPVPPVPRMRVDRYEGRPVTPEDALAGIGEGPPVEVVETFVARLTGISRTLLRTTVVTDDEVAGGLFDDPVVAGREAARMVTLRTTTPDGAVLRSAFYVEGAGGSWPVDLATVVPAAAADEPYVVRAADAGPGVSRFLVVHAGAATVRLVAADADDRPASPVVETGGRTTTLVQVGGGDPVGEYRVVLEDAGGRTVFDGVPVQGRNFWDE
jgi:hypothetical protein